MDIDAFQEASLFNPADPFLYTEGSRALYPISSTILFCSLFAKKKKKTYKQVEAGDVTVKLYNINIELSYKTPLFEWTFNKNRLQNYGPLGR